ncbi:MAG: hypothetical protein ACRC4L_02870 [Mycoplasma sp.]
MFSYKIAKIEVDLSFLNEIIIENDSYKNFLEDFRITIQNMNVFLNIQANHSAIVELRKIIEFITWQNMMDQGIHIEHIQEIISKNISKTIQASCGPKIREIWKKASKYFHYNNKSSLNIPTIFLNNNIENSNREIISNIFEILPHIEQMIRKILSNLEQNNYVKNYILLNEKIHTEIESDYTNDIEKSIIIYGSSYSSEYYEYMKTDIYDEEVILDVVKNKWNNSIDKMNGIMQSNLINEEFLIKFTSSNEDIILCSQYLNENLLLFKIVSAISLSKKRFF